MNKATSVKRQVRQTGDKLLIVSPFEFDDVVETSAIPSVIHLIPIGTWQHDLYGPIIINNADIREFLQNFNAGIRKGVYITAGHEGFDELPAVGWITSVEMRDTGLWGAVEWNDEGKALLSDKAFKFFSPEFCRDYEDPETHELYRNVLIGGALTKSPYFKELEAIVFSDKKARFSTNNVTMNLEELLAKKAEELSEEEKAFVKENAASLTEEQKAEFATVIEEPAAAPAVDPAPEAAPEASPAADPAPATDPVEASEKGNVTISASELAILRKKADEGQQAFAELQTAKLDTAVKALVFSDSNKAGKFLPKSTDNLRTFLTGLNEAQRTAFSTLINQLPNAQAFSEVGRTGAADGTAQQEVDTKVEAKLKANSKMTYSDALKEVMAENKGLEERFDRELTPVRATA